MTWLCGLGNEDRLQKPEFKAKVSRILSEASRLLVERDDMGE